MPDQQPTHDPRSDDEIQRDVLYALTEPGDNETLWSVGDLAREVDDLHVIDSVNALHRAGLINRTSEGYVFATRPAVRLIQIIGRVV
jgi:hypothetical protein